MRGRQASGAGWRVWLPALLVAVCTVAATAHGLFEVAVAAGVSPWLAWTYPASADGLALVAYAATHRLRGGAVGYAWLVTVLAAGLSGLAQGVYLASDPVVAVPALRFGVGVWPAVAGALVAHLLYLLAAPRRPVAGTVGALAASRNLPPAAPVALPQTSPANLPSGPAEPSRPVPAEPPTPTPMPTSRNDGTREGDPVRWARAQTPAAGWVRIQREFPDLTESAARNAAREAKSRRPLRRVQ